MEELRTQIWDLLFHAKEQRAVEEIARLLNQEVATIQSAVDHEWFSLADNLVSISIKD